MKRIDSILDFLCIVLPVVCATTHAVEGQFIATAAWVVSGMLAAFVIWRRRRCS